MLYPSIQGKLAIIMITQFIITDLALPHLKLSMDEDTRFSNTAVTVEKLAKVMNRKNRSPHILPPVIFMNTHGSVTKISDGPSAG